MAVNAAMNDTSGVLYSDYKTFAALYNSNGKLSGYVSTTLSNMTYGYEDPTWHFWIDIPPLSNHRTSHFSQSILLFYALRIFSCLNANHILP